MIKQNKVEVFVESKTGFPKKVSIDGIEINEVISYCHAIRADRRDIVNIEFYTSDVTTTQEFGGGDA